MKLVLVISNADFYGSEKHFFEIATHLSSNNNLKIIIFSDGILVDMLKQKSCDVLVLNEGHWLFSPRSFFRFFHYLRQFNPSLVCSHQPRANFWTAIITTLLRIRHISTIHSTPLQHSSNHSGIISFLVYVFHQLVRFSSELFSHKNIYVSKEAARTSFFPKKLVVIHNWIREIPPPIYSVDASKRAFLIISSLTKSKGIIEAISLFSEIFKIDKTATLSIVGWGKQEYVDSVMESINSLGVSTAVTLHGYQKDVSPYYRQASAFLSLTRDETFGLVFAEAMSFGLPIISSKIPVLEEIIPPWNLFIPLNESMPYAGRILEFIDQADGISEKNIAWATSSFLFANQIQKVQELYATVIGNKV